VTGGEEAKRECPECHSKRNWKDGIRKTNYSTVQRFRCQDCGYRFSEKSNIELDTNRGRQLSAILMEAKKLDAQTQTKKICAGDGNLLNYAWLLKKRGLADNTINLRVSTLKLIQKKGVDLHNPDSFETVIATEDLTSARKWMFVSCYKSYTKMMNIPWNPIRVKYEPKQPFLPTNDEIKTFIHASSKRLATLLQTLLTTGARIGEVCKLQWTDIDMEKNTITINDAEKGSRNRTIKVPEKTIAMINALPKRKSPYVFNTKPCNVRVIFQNLRRKLARSQYNTRLLQVHLHTFRHFYATELLRKTKNLSHVKYNLGHKSIMNTERYTHLVEFENMKYHSAVARTEQERRELIEDGWSFVEKEDGVSHYRKPK
jgi:site-specific recombinase XerD